MKSKKSKEKKVSGKDLAKVNLRKRFYKRLDTICSRVQKEKLEDDPILLMLKKHACNIYMSSASQLLQHPHKKAPQRLNRLWGEKLTSSLGL